MDKKKKISFFAFTYEDIVKSNIHPLSVQTSINKTTKLVYSIDNTGLYVIYNPQKKTVIPFEVK